MRFLLSTCLLIFASPSALQAGELSVERDAASGRVLIAERDSAPSRDSLLGKRAQHVAAMHCQTMGYSRIEREVQIHDTCLVQSAEGTCQSWQSQGEYTCAGKPGWNTPQAVAQSRFVARPSMAHAAP